MCFRSRWLSPHIRPSKHGSGVEICFVGRPHPYHRSIFHAATRNGEQRFSEQQSTLCQRLGFLPSFPRSLSPTLESVFLGSGTLSGHESLYVAQRFSKNGPSRRGLMGSLGYPKTAPCLFPGPSPHYAFLFPIALISATSSPLSPLACLQRRLIIV